MSDVNVMIVDCGELSAQLLKKAVGSVGGFKVCFFADGARGAAAAIPKFKPSLLLVSIGDAGCDAKDMLRFIRRMIPQYPVPVIICADDRSHAGEFLEAGAADVILKPKQGNFDGFRVSLGAAMKNAMNLRRIVSMGTEYTLRKSNTKMQRDDRLVLIGGSAGSTEVLPHILRGLPADCPPLAVTLHMPEGYTELYAKRLSDEGCALKVICAEEGARLRSGTAVLARGAQHMRVKLSENGYMVSSMAGERISGHCPSVDALFESAAQIAEHQRTVKMIAVILTGMGHDGAAGLLRLRKSGAYTIGQDEKTCMVYGMPKAAYELGAVDRQCGSHLIAAEIIKKMKEWKQQ